jgi:hypothetical protein
VLARTQRITPASHAPSSKLVQRVFAAMPRAAAQVDAKALRKAIKRRVPYLEANRQCALRACCRAAPTRARALSMLLRRENKPRFERKLRVCAAPRAAAR